jgi:hypothetical protein
MEPEDFGAVHEMVISLALRLRTGVDFFYNLPFFDVLDIMREAVKKWPKTVNTGWLLK